MKNIPNSLFRLLGGVIVLLFMYSCASFKLSTMHYDPIYGPEEVVLTVPSDVKIDTLSYSQLKWKLRTDFNFRYDYAQFAMNQPLSWYNRNFRYSYWRPFTSFDGIDITIGTIGHLIIHLTMVGDIIVSDGIIGIMDGDIGIVGIDRFIIGTIGTMGLGIILLTM